MTIEISEYVPILKWRQGEYQALMQLKPDSKNVVTPLLVIPPIEYDFEERRLKKTAHDHIEQFPSRYFAKWGGRKSMIDIHSSLEDNTMNDGIRILPFIFAELRKMDCCAIPVVEFSKSNSYKSDIKIITKLDGQGLCLKIRLTELMKPTFNQDILGLINFFNLPFSDIDLILDLEEPDNFEPYETFSKLITNGIKKISNLQSFRSFILASMSLKLSKITKPGANVTRHEWQLYKQVLSDLKSIRRPSYGDYTIETPRFVNMDMRMLKPAGKIVYACNDSWLVVKGVSFRGNNKQMIDLCATIISSGVYDGAGFSTGDTRIKGTAQQTENCGNLSTWKQVGVNHHIEKVVDQLSSFHAP